MGWGLLSNMWTSNMWTSEWRDIWLSAGHMKKHRQQRNQTMHSTSSQGQLSSVCVYVYSRDHICSITSVCTHVPVNTCSYQSQWWGWVPAGGQCQASIQSVLTVNSDLKSLDLRSLGASLPRSAIISSCWRKMHVQNVGEWTEVTFTTIYHYNWKKFNHITKFDVLSTGHEFFASIPSIFALENIF